MCGQLGSVQDSIRSGGLKAGDRGHIEEPALVNLLLRKALVALFQFLTCTLGVAGAQLVRTVDAELRVSHHLRPVRHLARVARRVSGSYLTIAWCSGVPFCEKVANCE